MWHEKRRQQHRAHWRKPDSQDRDYETITTELEVRTLIGLGKQYGREQVAARGRARTSGAPMTMAYGPTSSVEHDTAFPALAADLTAPGPPRSPWPGWASSTCPVATGETTTPAVTTAAT